MRNLSRAGVIVAACIFVAAQGCKSGDATKLTVERPAGALSAADRDAAAAQKTCPVSGEALGGMGTPVKLLVGGAPLFVCCNSCIKKVEADPAKYVAGLAGGSGSAKRP